MGIPIYRRLRSFLESLSRHRSTRKRRRNLPTASVGHVELLEPRQLLTVTFHGGALLTHVETQAVFLGNEWQTNPTLHPQTRQLDNYLSALVTGSYMDMLTNAGYNVGRGTSTAGAIDNITLSLTNGITDAQIRRDLQSMITSKHVNAPDANRLYVVYVEPGVAVYNFGSSSITAFLGYHGAFAGKTANNAPIDIHYAVMPYPGTPNPSPVKVGFADAFSELTVVTSHEVAEASTDPNGGYKVLGWYDDHHGEICDLTHSRATLDGYLVQQVVNQQDFSINPNFVQAPQSISVQALTSTSAKLSWTKVLGATGYRIYQVEGADTVLIANVGASAISFQVNKLVAGSLNTFKVEAFNRVSIADTKTVNIKLPSA